jgi:membrane-associated phospholipid phosphatase
MKRAVLSILAVTFAALNMQSAAAEERSRSFDFWTPHYLLDYGMGAGGLALELFYRGNPRQPALFGPAFDPANPSAIMDPSFSPVIGNPYVPEEDWSVPDVWLESAGYGQLLIVPAHELVARLATGRELSAHRFHHGLLTAFQATAVNAGMSRWIKSQTGRLRPDFQDRALHVHCSEGFDPTGFDCSQADPDRLIDDPEVARKALREGGYSFVSGHATNGMLIATNLALQTGGLWVWGEGATPVSKGIGIGAMGVLYGMGLYSGISRTHLMDGVHHTSDVVAGSLMGLAIGNLFYWLHWDTKGNPREQHWLNRRQPRDDAPIAIQDVSLTFGGAGMMIEGRW